MKRSIAVGALALTACGQGLDGTVVDANTGRPVANATVDIFNSGWGFRDGSLVWDKEYRTRATTDAAGRFHLDVDGGSNLTVIADGYAKVVTSACRSPMLVRIGGPYPDYLATSQIWMGIEAGKKRVGWSFAGRGSRVPETGADLRLVGPPPDMGDRTIALEAPLGMALVPGAGNPPSPPASGYVTRLKLDTITCGWLFVRSRNGGTFALQPASGTGEDPDGSRYALLTYRKPAS